MISIFQKGDFEKTVKFLKKSFGRKYMTVLERYAQEGVNALTAYTPVRTGLTSVCWSYEIIQNEDGFSIIWNNDNINNGVNIALILQMGHGTRGGGYFVGTDYINPALEAIFDKMADAAWKEVTSI